MKTTKYLVTTTITAMYIIKDKADLERREHSEYHFVVEVRFGFLLFKKLDMQFNIDK